MEQKIQREESEFISGIRELLIEARKSVVRQVNTTIGIILCRDKKDALVEITLPDETNPIFASKYQTVLPNKEELKALIEKKQTIITG